MPSNPGGAAGNAALDLQTFYAGRGVAKSADLGRDSPSEGRPADVFCGLQHVAGVDPAEKSATGNPYFRRSPFGTDGAPAKGNAPGCSR